LKLWNYDKIREDLVQYRDLEKKYNKLQRDVKLYQDGYLKHQSLIQLRTKLQQYKKENRTLKRENEVLSRQLKGVLKKSGSPIIEDKLRDQLDKLAAKGSRFKGYTDELAEVRSANSSSGESDSPGRSQEQIGQSLPTWDLK